MMKTEVHTLTGQHGYLSVLIFLLVSLTACGQTFIPSDTPVPTVTPIPLTPTPTVTPETWVEVEIAAANLILSLPDTWVIGDAQLTPLGLVINLGPEPLGPGPFSSTLVIADPAHYEAESLAAALSCSEPCAIPLETTTLAGQPAQRAILGAETTTPLEWYFLEHGGQLLAFTLHDATTLSTRADILASLELIEVVVVVPTATPSLTPIPPTITPTPPPPTPTPGPPTDEPLDVTIAFLRAAANDPETLGLTFLSDNLRNQVGTGTTLLQLMSLSEPFSTFEILFLGPIEGVLTYRAQLQFLDGRTTWRLIKVIAEDGQWVMNDFQVIEPPATTPTSTATLEVTPTAEPE